MGVGVITPFISHAQQAAGFEYTPEQLETSLNGTLAAREALLRQMTNKGPDGKPAYQTGPDGQFILDRNGNKIPLPPGYLEVATANDAPKDLIQVLTAAIAAIRAEVAILDRCTATFPKTDKETADCLADLQRSSRAIAQAIDRAIQALQDKIQTLNSAPAFLVGGAEAKASKLQVLNGVLMVAQAQKGTVATSLNNWNQYARGTVIKPDPVPMPMPDPKPDTDNSTPSPFTPVPDGDEPPISFPVPRPRPPTSTPPTGPLSYPCPRPPRPVTPTSTPPTTPPKPKPKPKPPVAPKPLPPATILFPTYQGNTITGYEEHPANQIPQLPAGWIYRYEVRSDGKTYAVPVRVLAPAPTQRPYVPLEALPSYR